MQTKSGGTKENADTKTGFGDMVYKFILVPCIYGDFGNGFLGSPHCQDVIRRAPSVGGLNHGRRRVEVGKWTESPGFLGLNTFSCLN